MKRIFICLILCFVLSMPLITHAKTCGPQWAIWTHSRDRGECRVKTITWIILGTLSLMYVVGKTEKFDLSVGILDNPDTESPNDFFLGFKFTW